MSPPLKESVIRDTISGYICFRSFSGFGKVEYWKKISKASCGTGPSSQRRLPLLGCLWKQNRTRSGCMGGQPGTRTSLCTSQSEVSPGMLAWSVGSWALNQTYWIRIPWGRSFLQGRVWEMLPLASSSQDLRLFLCHWLDPSLKDKTSLSPYLIPFTSPGFSSRSVHVWTCVCLPTSPVRFRMSRCLVAVPPPTRCMDLCSSPWMDLAFSKLKASAHLSPHMTSLSMSSFTRLLIIAPSSSNVSFPWNPSCTSQNCHRSSALLLSEWFSLLQGSFLFGDQPLLSLILDSARLWSERAELGSW